MDYVEQYIRAQQLKEVLKDKRILKIELTPHFDTQLRLGFSYFSNIDLINKRIERVFYERGVIVIHFETDIYMQIYAPEVLYHENEDTIPEVYGIKCVLNDNTYLTIHIPGMGGFLHVIPKEEFEERNGLPLHTSDKNQLHAFELDKFTYENFRLQLLSKAKTMISNAITVIGDIGYIPDVFYTARINPRIKTEKLTEEELHKLYNAIISCNNEMLQLHGDCQKIDIYGQKGRYCKKMHGKLKDKLCPICGSKIAKQVNTTGMAVYYCPECQPYRE